MPIDSAGLAGLLDPLRDKHGVPGASLAVLDDGDVVTAASGVLSMATGVDATTDSLFQIGSITKLWTATVVMQLVDEGRIDLDAPVRTYLPAFTVADPEISATVTVRHLLTHTSGIDGDHFQDTGRGDDVLERYVESCVQLAQVHPLGATMSYCNAGFGVLGRVLEKVTGKVWDEVLRDELVLPLGLTRTMTLPEDALRYRVACGHVGTPGELRLTPQWGIPRSSGPAGLILATAEDVVRFAKAFLDGGRAADGTQWLQPDSVAAMREPQVEVPDRFTLGRHWGVGWIHYDYGAGVFGHDGTTLGQNAYLRIVPGRNVAVAILTNGGGAADLAHTLLTELLSELADVDVPARPEPVQGASGGHRSLQAGRYVRAAATIEVGEHGDSGLELVMTNTSALADVLDAQPLRVELLPLEENTYVGRLPASEGWTAFVFFTLPDGSRYIHFGARATQKVA